jgi:hypothetical protein
VITAIALPLRAAGGLPNCIVCRGMAAYRCSECSAPLCDQQCAVEHGLDAHGILPRRHPRRRREGR